MFSKPIFARKFLSVIDDFHAVRIFHQGLWSDTKILTKALKEPYKGPKIHTTNKHVIKMSVVKSPPLPVSVWNLPQFQVPLPKPLESMFLFLKGGIFVRNLTQILPWVKWVVQSNKQRYRLAIFTKQILKDCRMCTVNFQLFP